MDHLIHGQARRCFGHSEVGPRVPGEAVFQVLSFRIRVLYELGVVAELVEVKEALPARIETEPHLSTEFHMVEVLCMVLVMWLPPPKDGIQIEVLEGVEEESDSVDSLEGEAAVVPPIVESKSHTFYLTCTQCTVCSIRTFISIRRNQVLVKLPDLLKLDADEVISFLNAKDEAFGEVMKSDFYGVEGKEQLKALVNILGEKLCGPVILIQQRNPLVAKCCTESFLHHVNTLVLGLVDSFSGPGAET